MEKETRKYKVTVVPTTHWDRAWYLPFEQFRMKLVKLISNLLDILRTRPDYRALGRDKPKRWASKTKDT